MEPKTKNQIRYIKTADIVPHPDNPRQDLGDLTELADSIRANGVLENLVVIRNPENFKRIAFPGSEGSAEVWNNADAPEFVVVIGHRRLAAAKLAGLDAVPCVVRDMTRDEAIAAMLTENGQRTALTPYEETRGFQQLSLDMGKSVRQISDILWGNDHPGASENRRSGQRENTKGLGARRDTFRLRGAEQTQRPGLEEQSSGEGRDTEFQERVEVRQTGGTTSGTA